MTAVPEYGFIMKRRVISEETNINWFECYKCIRKHYDYKIVIIDDFSHPAFIKCKEELIHCEVIPSYFVSDWGNGWLPYYCFSHYFEKAIIIHETFFLQGKLDLGKTKYLQKDSDLASLKDYGILDYHGRVHK